MALFGIVIPALLIATTAVFAHVRRPRYWPAVRLSTAVSARWAALYFAVLRLAFFDRTPLGPNDLFGIAAAAAACGALAGAAAMAVGLAFSADRRIERRRFARQADHPEGPT